MRIRRRAVCDVAICWVAWAWAWVACFYMASRLSNSNSIVLKTQAATQAHFRGESHCAYPGISHIAHE